MKKMIALSVITIATLSITPAYAMEITADKIATVQEYSGNARIVLKPGEITEITSDKITYDNGVTSFSGKVIAELSDYTLKSDAVTVKALPDGTSLLQAQKFILDPTD